nr:winged helix-turn-helix transcriptional regulator [Candidatus Frankia alpina]
MPPSVYYSLTGLGRSLNEPLAALRDWAETHMPAIDEHRSAIATRFRGTS